MEGDVVVLQDIYTFDFSMGIDEEGTFRGHLKSTGIRPSFSERLADYGISLEPSLFSNAPVARVGAVADDASLTVLALAAPSKLVFAVLLAAAVLAFALALIFMSGTTSGASIEERLGELAPRPGGRRRRVRPARQGATRSSPRPRS